MRTARLCAVVDMKGIELPINVLIIVVIAIIVLIALVSMFYNPVNVGGSVVGLDNAKSQACRSLSVGYGCDKNADLDDIMVYDFDANGDGNMDSEDTLMALCEDKYAIGDESACRQLCGCPA